LRKKRKRIEREGDADLIERLESRVTDYKKELGDALELAQEWRIREFVVRKYLFQINKQSPEPFWYESDLEAEISIQEKRLIESWKNGEVWWKKLF